jgi:hypothetical protein
MTDIAKFWGVSAIFFGVAYLVVSIAMEGKVGLVPLAVAWGVVGAGLATMMLANIADALRRIADLQVSPENRLMVTQDPRKLMGRGGTAKPTNTPAEDLHTPAHKRNLPGFRKAI